VVSIFKKRQNPNNGARGRKEVIQMLLFILGAIIAVVLGLYGGLASSHHH
jgi:hypothetical protein